MAAYVHNRYACRCTCTVMQVHLHAHCIVAIWARTFNAQTKIAGILLFFNWPTPRNCMTQLVYLLHPISHPLPRQHNHYCCCFPFIWFRQKCNALFLRLVIAVKFPLLPLQTKWRHRFSLNKKRHLTATVFCSGWNPGGYKIAWYFCCCPNSTYQNHCCFTPTFHVATWQLDCAAFNCYVITKASQTASQMQVEYSRLSSVTKNTREHVTS